MQGTCFEPCRDGGGQPLSAGDDLMGRARLAHEKEAESRHAGRIDRRERVGLSERGLFCVRELTDANHAHRRRGRRRHELIDVVPFCTHTVVAGQPLALLRRRAGVAMFCAEALDTVGGSGTSIDGFGGGADRIRARKSLLIVIGYQGETARSRRWMIWNMAEHRMCHRKMIVRRTSAGVGRDSPPLTRLKYRTKVFLWKTFVSHSFPNFTPLSLA